MPDLPDRPVNAEFDPVVIEVLVEESEETEERPFGSTGTVQRIGVDLRESLDGTSRVGDLGRIAERRSDEPHLPPDA